MLKTETRTKTMSSRMSRNNDSRAKTMYCPTPTAACRARCGASSSQSSLCRFEEVRPGVPLPCRHRPHLLPLPRHHPPLRLLHCHPPLHHRPPAGAPGGWREDVLAQARPGAGVEDGGCSSPWRSAGRCPSPGSPWCRSRGRLLQQQP